MRQKNNFRIHRKRFPLSGFFGVAFFIFFFASSVSAQAYSSNDLLNAYKGYVSEPVVPSASPASTQLSMSSSDLSSAYKNYVAEAPAPPTPEPTTQPPVSPTPEPTTKPTTATPSPVFTSSANIYNATLASALRELLKTKEVSSQLRGPQGPSGPQGPTGQKGETKETTLFVGQPATSIQPSAPVTNPVVFMPVGVTYADSSKNFTGGTYSTIANLTSNLFTNNVSNITTLNVAGATTLTGALNVTGTATIPSLVATVSSTDSLTIGGGYGATGVTISTTGNIEGNGTLTIDGASTLAGGYASTGVTVSDVGNLSAAGTLTIDGTSTLSGEVTIGGGYGSTGVTIADNGNIQTNGTLTVDGIVNFGGGSITPSGQFVLTHVPTLPHNYTSFPAGTSNVADSTVYINPASSVGDGNLFSAAVGGVVKFQVDSEGDIFGKNLILTGTTSLGSTDIAGTLVVQGNTTLGDAASDTLTLNGTAILAPNNLGIGTTTPSAIFDVYGNSGTTTTSSTINSLGTAGTGNITVASTSGFPTTGVFVVKNATNEYEALAYTVVDATTLNVTARARLGTSAPLAAHPNGATLAFIETIVSKGVTTIPHNVVTSAGNFGIGTATPLTRLTVASATADGITIRNTGESTDNEVFGITNKGT